MLSKNHIKLIKSLQIKKYRKEHGLFIVEGKKNVGELLKSDFIINELYATPAYEDFVQKAVAKRGVKVEYISEDALSDLGTYETNSMLAVVQCKPPTHIVPHRSELVLALDQIQDPGNFGTIIRTADWFGLNKIICSNTCADFYNPKVISATMGSFTRVAVEYCDLARKLKNCADEGIEIFGAFMDGTDIKQCIEKNGILVMGNEGNGIGEEVLPLISRRLAITGRGVAESLNVAIATGILLHHMTN